MEPVKFGTAEIFLDDVKKFHFHYIKPDEKTCEYLEAARSEYMQLLSLLHTIPPSRERSIAITALEKSLMFATKAIVVAS